MTHFHSRSRHNCHNKSMNEIHTFCCPRLPQPERVSVHKEWNLVLDAQSHVRRCDLVHAYMLRTLDVSSKLVRKHVEQDRAVHVAEIADLAPAAAAAHDSRALY